MTEREYIDATDLAKLKTIGFILKDCMCMDDPNKTRLRSVATNVSLMIDDINSRIKPLYIGEEG